MVDRRHERGSSLGGEVPRADGATGEDAKHESEAHVHGAEADRLRALRSLREDERRAAGAQLLDEAWQVGRLVLAIRIHGDDDVVRADLGRHVAQPVDDRPLVTETARRRQHSDVGEPRELGDLMVGAG